MKKSIKNCSFFILLCCFIFSCGKNSNNNTTTNSSSDPCEDMRSYNAGVQYGKDDKGGSRISGLPTSTCEGILNYYDDNYNKDCFCKGFYKGQSEG
ncbi:hypothetical protein [Algoriphagus sanaruensis]|uniref:Lipoprotein n=1 Tax=Algoriphagus sanaruensis TaxID=1727163 RepID=A0A142EK97_9BACT|nr:hypothetical protein [Algoriphagus sanaruensis]AMQ55552.1 hypothetical protein AO498_03990 [Algoriphagus sanaruensis]